MARKKRKLSWDDVADICAHQLRRMGAFVPDYCDQLELEGAGIKEPATVMTDSEGKSLTLVYGWHDQGDTTTVRRRVVLDTIRRPFGLETVFRCPDCGRKCHRLALLRSGLRCAECGPIVLGSTREGKVARLVRRANLISYKLGLNSWTERPVAKPAHMRMQRYVSLLGQRERVLAKIQAQLSRRRRRYGMIPVHLADLHSAIGGDCEPSN
jgi:DNA-directed RNA polymerase subunit RPC12/RpoP